MASIEIKRQHNRSLPEAKNAVQEVAEHLSERFGMDYEWHDDVLAFSGSGVEGQIQVLAKHVQVSAHLGFLLMAFKPTVEREIEKYLDEVFGD